MQNAGRAMNGDTSDATDARAKKKKTQSTTTVKVVASRYALALQKTRQEAQQRQQSRHKDQDQVKSSATSSSHQRSRTSTAPLTSNKASNAQAGVEQPARPRAQSGSVSSSVSARKNTSGSTPSAAGTKRHLPDADRPNGDDARGATSPMDMKARLEAYRANKQHRTLQEKTHSHRKSPPSIPAATTFESKLVSAGRSRAAAPISANANVPPRSSSSARPAFPKRITSVPRTGRPTQQSPTLMSPTLKSPKNRATQSNQHGARGFDRIDTAKAHRAQPQATDSEELEILQSLYYQLCFVEAKSDAAFCRQESEAQRQLLGAWELLQTKLRLLHDTTLRLDRERHIAELDSHIAVQASPVFDTASQLPHTLESLQLVWDSLESALHRMPTPGLACSPEKLKSQMEVLVANADQVLHHIRAYRLDRAVSGAVTFEREMKSASEKLSQLLMQLAHMLEELQVEVDTETSVVIQRIQSLRVSSMAKDAPSLTYKT